MTDIKLIIKISEDSYKATCNGYMLPPDVENIVQGIKNGTPYETVTEFADRCRECGREKVLDKIRSDIEQTTSRYCISRERGGSGQVEWSDRLIKESEVLKIIDKYRAESEEK